MQGVLGSDWMHIWSSALSAQPVHMARPVPLSCFSWHVQRGIGCVKNSGFKAVEKGSPTLHREFTNACDWHGKSCLLAPVLISLWLQLDSIEVRKVTICFRWARLSIVIHIYIYYFPWSRIRARMHVCCSSSDAELHPSETNSSIHDGSHAAAPS